MGQLEGREAVVLLTDGRGEDAALIPRLPQALGIRRTGYHPGLLPRQLDARLLPQAQGTGVAVQGLDAQAAAGVEEVHVAGIRQGLGQGLQPVGPALLPVKPALWLGGFIIGIAAGVQDLRLRGHDALLQGRRRRHQLEGGARGIQALHGPVEQGVGGVLGQGLVLTGKGLRVVAREAGHGQNSPVPHVQHHCRHRRSLGMALQKLPQGFLQGLL